MGKIQEPIFKLVLATLTATVGFFFAMAAGPLVRTNAASQPVLESGQGEGQGRGHHKARDDDDQGEDEDSDHGAARKGTIRPRQPGATITIVFRPRDRQVIRQYFGNDYGNLPPGLAKRGGNLPPGLEKHLERNGTLPPGLQKRLTPFPVELSRRLPRLPDIYVRGTIGRDAVIVNTSTGQIVDIMRGVLNR